MKSLMPFILLMCSVFVVQAQPNVSDKILNALTNGDVAALSECFNDNVELVVGSTSDVFSKQQATGIVTDFFRKNKVQTFEILHKGNKDSSAFAIGTMKAGNATYRVYVLTRTRSGQQLIQQLRIESTND
jgi:ketosteroid isomerase-like protein